MLVDGKALRLVRQRSGWNAKDFAEALGISKQYLNDIEGGRRTLKRNPALIKKLAQKLKCPVSMITTAESL